jgi:hypothetical protein
MASFIITSNGKRYKITAPDKATAIKAFASKFGAPQQQPAAPPPAQQLDQHGQEIISDADPRAGLPIPGTVSAAQARGGAPPTGVVPPSRHFGFSSSDNPNPLPALDTFAQQFEDNIPILGPTLTKMDRSMDAVINNHVVAPLTGGPRVTPEQLTQRAQQQAEANPEIAGAGRLAGWMAPYAAASGVPLLATGLGMEGGLASRFAWGIPSSYGINAGDAMARGKEPSQALTDAIIPTAEGAPFFMFGGKGGKMATGPRADAVAVMDAEGVPLTAGQKSGNRNMQYAESELGGSAAETAMDRQREAYTSAALKRAGVDAPRATPDVMDAAFTKLGGHFDQLAANTTVPLDIRRQNDLLGVLDDYTSTVAQPAPIVEKMVNRVGELAAQNGGVLKGESYKSIRTELGAYMKRSTGETQQYLKDLQEALDDAVERHMSPKMLEAWQVTRTRYKNLLDIEDAVSRAGQDAALGLVSPASLSGALRRGNRRAYVRGKGDLNDLARAGVATMTPLPNSGTASRMFVRGATSSPAMIAGALAGHDTAGLPGAIAGGLAGTVAPWMIGRALMSRPGNSFLSGETSPAIGIIARALLSNAQGGQ